MYKKLLALTASFPIAWTTASYLKLQYDIEMAQRKHIQEIKNKYGNMLDELTSILSHKHRILSEDFSKKELLGMLRCERSRKIVTKNLKNFQVALNSAVVMEEVKDKTHQKGIRELQFPSQAFMEAEVNWFFDGLLDVLSVRVADCRLQRDGHLYSTHYDFDFRNGFKLSKQKAQPSNYHIKNIENAITHRQATIEKTLGDRLISEMKPNLLRTMKSDILGAKILRPCEKKLYEEWRNSSPPVKMGNFINSIFFAKRPPQAIVFQDQESERNSIDIFEPPNRLMSKICSAYRRSSQ